MSMTTAHEHWYGVNWPLLSLLCIQYGDKRASRRHYTRVPPPPSPAVPLVMALQSNKWNGRIERVRVLAKNSSICDWKKGCSSKAFGYLYRIGQNSLIKRREYASSSRWILHKMNLLLWSIRRWRSDDVSREATNSLFKENGKAIEIGIGKLIFLSSHFFFNDYLNKCSSSSSSSF